MEFFGKWLLITSGIFVGSALFNIIFGFLFLNPLRELEKYAI